MCICNAWLIVCLPCKEGNIWQNSCIKRGVSFQDACHHVHCHVRGGWLAETVSKTNLKGTDRLYMPSLAQLVHAGMVDEAMNVYMAMSYETSLASVKGTGNADLDHEYVAGITAQHRQLFSDTAGGHDLGHDCPLI